ncbi:hypothetical protein HHK36_007672 [Tetracentron sinense]|uniref:Uncharacterized protein n=1 Tax=Tetracentron sinense TaxID=13715 RepID=A0A834ZS86_TETSI|nr:hypothetical protein HHK36_007672 [Tetracentron sinense]
MGTGSDSNGWRRARGLVLKTIVLIGGVLVLKRSTKSTTRWDHARIVAQSLSGEKFSMEQASRDPDNYFNLRISGILLNVLVPFLMNEIKETFSDFEIIQKMDGDVIYVLKGEILTDSWLQRFCMVKPCPKEMKCNVELSSFAIRDAEEYKNFCDRPREQRPLPEEVIGDIAEHLTTIYLKQCERGKRCLYEGSTPPGGFPNSWNGATYCTSELAVLKNNEIHTWDRGYDNVGNHIWGVKVGPYEFKPAPALSFNDMLSPLNFPPLSMENRIEGSFVLQE